MRPCRSRCYCFSKSESRITFLPILSPRVLRLPYTCYENDYRGNHRLKLRYSKTGVPLQSVRRGQSLRVYNILLISVFTRGLRIVALNHFTFYYFVIDDTRLNIDGGGVVFKYTTSGFEVMEPYTNMNFCPGNFLMHSILLR